MEKKYHFDGEDDWEEGRRNGHHKHGKRDRHTDDSDDDDFTDWEDTKDWDVETDDDDL